MYPDHAHFLPVSTSAPLTLPLRLWAAGASGGTFLTQLCIFSITRSWAFAEENALSSNLLVPQFLDLTLQTAKEAKRMCRGGQIIPNMQELIHYQPENSLHNNPWHNRLLLTPPAKWRDGQHGRGQFGQWVVLVEFGIVWLDSAKFGKDWSLRWR